MELTEQTVRISCRRHRRKYYTVWLEHRQQFILENYLRVKHLRKNVNIARLPFLVYTLNGVGYRYTTNKCMLSLNKARF